MLMDLSGSLLGKNLTGGLTVLLQSLQPLRFRLKLMAKWVAILLESDSSRGIGGFPLYLYIA